MFAARLPYPTPLSMRRFTRQLSLSETLWSKTGCLDLRNSPRIDLRGKSLSASDVDAIADELAENSGLEQLDLSHNGFGGDGAGAVAKIVRACPGLTSLCVDSNNLRAAAAEVGEAVASHASLRALSISANVIGPTATKAFARAVASSPSLETLDFSANAFGPVGGRALAEALSSSAHSSKLRRLDLTACGVGPSGAVALAEALSAHRLAHIEMTTNFIGPEGLAAFAAMLQDNTALEDLSLSDNAIGELGDRATGTCGSALATALEGNSTLRVLDLTYNALSPAAMELLRNATERRETPLELRL